MYWNWKLKWRTRQKSISNEAVIIIYMYTRVLFYTAINLKDPWIEWLSLPSICVIGVKLYKYIQYSIQERVCIPWWHRGDYLVHWILSRRPMHRGMYSHNWVRRRHGICTSSLLCFSLNKWIKGSFSVHTYSLQGREIISHFLTSSHQQFVIIEAERRVELWMMHACMHCINGHLH